MTRKRTSTVLVKPTKRTQTLAAKSASPIFMPIANPAMHASIAIRKFVNACYLISPVAMESPMTPFLMVPDQSVDQGPAAGKNIVFLAIFVMVKTSAPARRSARMA